MLSGEWNIEDMYKEDVLLVFQIIFDNIKLLIVLKIFNNFQFIVTVIFEMYFCWPKIKPWDPKYIIVFNLDMIAGLTYLVTQFESM